MKIFAYHESLVIAPKILKKLSKAGYICVPVSDVTKVKVIEPLPEETSNFLLQAALKAVDDGIGSKDAFAKYLIKSLTAPSLLKEVRNG